MGARRFAIALLLGASLVVTGCGLLAGLRGSSVELASPDGGPSVRVTFQRPAFLDGGLSLDGGRDASGE